MRIAFPPRAPRLRVRPKVSRGAAGDAELCRRQSYYSTERYRVYTLFFSVSSVAPW